MTPAALGLGGNIGDPRGQMAAAIRSLAANPAIEIRAVSALYKTPPWGKTDQPPFLNAAVLIETQLQPRALLAEMLAVEQQLGRQREERWGPRSLDIDILLFGFETIAEPGLHIPHPRLHERAFALAPLADVVPEARFGGRSAAEWLAGVDRTGIERLAEPGWQATAVR
jgi:2-amino-4-hydroxy-6-hydroxymethyldihydropteridine diphosphokinase